MCQPLPFLEAQLECIQISKIELFDKIVNG